MGDGVELRSRNPILPRELIAVTQTALIVILAAYALASVATFVAYGIDKRRAVRQQRRIPESTLHWMELAGGWPGALAGQTVFRHKRRKFAFMVVFMGIAALHVAAWAYLWLRGLPLMPG